MGEIDIGAIRFIDRLYRDLYKSPEVLHHSTGNETDKFNNIAMYMKNLEEMHNRAALGKNRIKILKKMYYDKYVIKRENIPESYYQHQQKIAFERGYGHVDIIDVEKKELQDEIIENQKRSIDAWLDYFLSEDTKFYPFWAKYWAFQGMLKIGKYDKAKGIFNKRTNETVAPFVDLNREALSLSIDLITRYVRKEKNEDDELKKIIASESFQKIYPYILTKVLSNNENIIKRNEGIWVKYNQGSDYMPLVNSLKGYNTGWCTASDGTAKSQLENGDFYVYYTLDENNEYKVPRIAIRMEHGQIGEIRGVAENQNIESEMENVVAEKIKDFPDKDKYYKKVNDMKQMTHIYNKHQNNEELTIEELIFLYEINSKIEGFGYSKDPRIEEIINKRPNKKSDLARIFNCDISQIALNKEEITNNTIYYRGDLDLSSLTSAEGLVLPETVGGDLYLSSLTSAEGLVLPKTIGGSLKLSSLISAEGLVLPKTVGEGLYLNSLASAEGLELPKTVSGDLDLSSLTSAEGLVLPETVGGYLSLSSLTSGEGLVLPQTVGEGLYLNSLTSAEGLELPKTVSGELDLSSLTSGEGLVLPETVGGNLDLSSLTSGEGLVLPKTVSGHLYLSSLTSAEGLVLPETVGGDLYLSSLTSGEGLVLPKTVSGDLDLSSLTSAEGLVLPETVGGELDLSSLTSAEGLELPKTIGGSLKLSSLASAEGLVLPKTVGEGLYLNSLASAEGLVLPKTVSGDLDLSSLTSGEGLVLPKTVGEGLYLNSLTSAEGLVLPQTVGEGLYLNSLTSAEGLVLPQTVGEGLYLNSLTSTEGLIFPDNLTYIIFMKDLIITSSNVDEYRNNNTK